MICCLSKHFCQFAIYTICTVCQYGNQMLLINYLDAFSVKLRRFRLSWLSNQLRMRLVLFPIRLLFRFLPAEVRCIDLKSAAQETAVTASTTAVRSVVCLRVSTLLSFSHWPDGAVVCAILTHRILFNLTKAVLVRVLVYYCSFSHRHHTKWSSAYNFRKPFLLSSWWLLLWLNKTL